MLSKISFLSLMGPLRSVDIYQSLWLIIEGMVGILIVMLLIYLVVIWVNKIMNKIEMSIDKNR